MGNSLLGAGCFSAVIVLIGAVLTLVWAVLLLFLVSKIVDRAREISEAMSIVSGQLDKLIRELHQHFAAQNGARSNPT
jgi:uncharacterized membrane-anchored protein YhcB (DUF1043 family)